MGATVARSGLATLWTLDVVFAHGDIRNLIGYVRQTKAKQSESKANKEATTCSCGCLLLSFFFFRFLTRNVQRILLTVKRSHTCRSGTRKNAKKRQHKCKNKANCAAFAFSFAFVLLFFPALFSQKNIFDGWSCMAAIAEHNSSGFILFAF